MQNILDLSLKVGDRAIVVEAEIGKRDTDAEVLFVGIIGRHLTPFVGKKSVERDMVGLATTQHYPIVADMCIGIDSEKIEIIFATEGGHLARSTDALDNAILAR